MDLCRLLLEAMPGLHVLVLDVDEDQKLVASAISAGASGLVPDTSDEQDLVDAIETAAAGRMVMSPTELMSILNGARESVANDPLAKLTPLAPGTVRNYVSRLLRKLAFECRAQVVALAARRDSD